MVHNFKKIQDEKCIEKIRAIEEELGVVLIATEPKLYNATLTEQQIERLRMVERELGVVLLAYEAHSAFITAIR
jgi:hypothetical protein